MAAEASGLAVSLGPLVLKNPVLAAAGTFGYGTEFQEFFDLAALGGIIVKTLTLAPRPGNPSPRVVETPSGMLNAVGLQNVGIDAFLADKWPELRRLGVPIILSVAGFTKDEFVALAQKTKDSGAAALELNLSCPNVAHGPGARCFAQNPEETLAVVRAVRQETALPVIAKLSPEVSDVGAIARAASEGGADILSLINTLPGMVIDVDSERPVLANKTGGLSGPAMHPVAVRCVWEAAEAVKTPILGVGGISSGRDALEMILAGASAIAVGTASFWNPRAPKIVLDELTALIRKKGRSARELVGAAREKSS
jgi:dihydroorotate dehydrogenase (NAD+) catalytic subunit